MRRAIGPGSTLARLFVDRVCRGQLGQTMVEYALGLTILLYLMMGVVDFGRAFMLYNVVANTAREGARYGTIGSRSASDIISFAIGTTGGISGITVTVPARGTAGSTPVQVQASATFVPITPLISAICCGGGTLTLTAQSSMYIEPY